MLAITALGVDPLVALAYLATLDQVDRFRESRNAGIDVDLKSRGYQACETDVQGDISRCGDELARITCMRPRTRC